MTSALLDAQGLHVGYGGKPVLIDVSIQLRAREVLCLIGHNGAGKSTLARTLFGLVKPTSGRITVDGRTLDPHVDGMLVQGGRGLDVGDKVTVKLISTNPERGFIDFAVQA